MRLLLVAVALPAAAAAVLICAAGPRYGRTRRAGLAAHWGSRVLLWLLGIRLRRHGTPRTGPALVVANYISWLDVLVITAMTPVLPVAKCEVADWPVIGILARRVGAIFVQRKPGRELLDTVAQITLALRRGHRVLIFPAGTARCGGPPTLFRRAGFQAAVDAAVAIAPVSIDYLDGHGIRTVHPALVGDVWLVASIWRVMRADRIVADVTWLPIVPAIQDGGHRASHRVRAASRTHRRISGVLSPGAVGRPTVAPTELRPTGLDRPIRAA